MLNGRTLRTTRAQEEGAARQQRRRARDLRRRHRTEESLRLSLAARTEVAAVFYSLIESAKLVGVEPAEYLRRAAEAALASAEPIIPSDLAEPLA